MSFLAVWVLCSLVTMLSATTLEDEIFEEDGYNPPTTGQEIENRKNSSYKNTLRIMQPPENFPDTANIDRRMELKESVRKTNKHIKIDCPIHWNYRCTAPLNRLRFSRLSNAKAYCDDIGGYIGGNNCNVEPRTRLSRNECCRPE